MELQRLKPDGAADEMSWLKPMTHKATAEAKPGAVEDGGIACTVYRGVDVVAQAGMPTPRQR